MTPDAVARVRAHPAYAELLASRGTFSRALCAAMLVIYFGFILLVAYGHDIVGQLVAPSISLAFPLGLGVILVAILITGIYVVRANGRYDRLTARIRSDVL